MPTMIQSAARKPGKTHYGVIKLGPKLPTNGVVFDITHLPNPYGKLQNFKFTENIPDAEWPIRKRDQVKLFLRTLAPRKLDKVIEKARKEIESGNPIAVVCARGRDRSPAVAEMIGDFFHPSRVFYSHRELTTTCGDDW